MSFSAKFAFANEDEKKRQHSGSGGSFGDDEYSGETIPVDMPTRALLQDSWKTNTDYRKRPMYRQKYPWDVDINRSISDILKADNYGNSLGDEIVSDIKGSLGELGSAAKDIVSKGQSVISSFTSPQVGTTAKPIVYSDWSPAARFFGMNQDTAYSEHMVNTAHQREVADFKAAGLNPVLGISGSGSSGVSGNVAFGSSSALKTDNIWLDVLGATAAVVTAVATKNPMYGYMVSNIFKAFD